MIQEAGIDCDIEHVALDQGAHMAPDFLQINPNHQVPTLVDGGVVLHESHAILRYLCRKHGLDTWYPIDPAAAAWVDQWLDWTQCRLGVATLDIVYNTVFAGDAADKQAIERGHVLLLETAPIMEAALGKNDYLAGNTPTIADLAAASNITHLKLANAMPDGPAIASWIDRMVKIKGFADTLPRIPPAQ